MAKVERTDKPVSVLVIKENIMKHNHCMECPQLILQKAPQELECLLGELEV